MGRGVVYLSEMTKVIAVLRFGNDGGYGKIRKVHISRMVNSPTKVDFARKIFNAASEKAKQKKQVVDAMACMIEYARLIKFWATNSQIIEAYTLWWNGGSVRSFGKINSKVLPALESIYSPSLQLYHARTGDDPSVPHQEYKACYIIDNNYGSYPQKQNPPQQHFSFQHLAPFSTRPYR